MAFRDALGAMFRPRNPYSIATPPFLPDDGSASAPPQPPYLDSGSPPPPPELEARLGNPPPPPPAIDSRPAAAPPANPETQNYLDLLKQGPPKRPQAGALRTIADTAAGMFLGPQNAQRMLHPKYSQQMQDYGQQLGQAEEELKASALARQQQAGISKAQAETAEANARAGMLNTQSELAKTDSKNPYITVPQNSGLYNRKEGKWVQPPKTGTENYLEVPKPIADALQLQPGLKVPPTELDSYIRTYEAHQAAQGKTPEAMLQERTKIADSVKLTGRDRRVFLATGRIERPQSISVTTAGATPNDSKDIAKAIIEGKQAPELTGLYRYGAPVRAELSRSGYDQASALRDWRAIQRHLATLNGPQQERLRQAVNFTYDSLDVIENLYNEWKQKAGVSGVRVFNKGKLAVSKQLPGDAGSIAQNLEAQINDLVSELGAVYKGGNSSTDESLKLAANNLSADWNEQTFKRALDQIRTNLRIRRNSINTSEPAGVSPNSPYMPPAQSQSSGTTVRMKAPNGQERDVPASEVDHYKKLGATVVQ